MRPNNPSDVKPAQGVPAAQPISSGNSNTSCIVFCTARKAASQENVLQQKNQIGSMSLGFHGVLSGSENTKRFVWKPSKQSLETTIRRVHIARLVEQAEGTPQE